MLASKETVDQVVGRSYASSSHTDLNPIGHPSRLSAFDFSSDSAQTHGSAAHTARPCDSGSQSIAGNDSVVRDAMKILVAFLYELVAMSCR